MTDCRVRSASRLRTSDKRHKREAELFYAAGDRAQSWSSRLKEEKKKKTEQCKKESLVFIN